MSGEATTDNNDIDMVDIDLEKDKKEDDDEKKEKPRKVRHDSKAVTTTKSPKQQRPQRLLPAALYATVMGRHVIDWSTSDEQSQILLEWPGVRFTFLVKSTTSISVRLQTSGAVFAYHILSVHNNGDNTSTKTTTTTTTTTTAMVVEEQVLGGGGLFGRGIKDHVLAKDLDTNLVYQVEIWKRNDPGSISRLHGLLVDDNDKGGMGIKPNKHGQFPSNPYIISNKKNATTTTTTTSSALALHLEFVGDDDTVGFGNLSIKSSIWYYGLCQMTCLPLFRSLYRATDVTQSWPVHLCKGLQKNYQSNEMSANGVVQYSIIAWSGIGAKYSLGLQDDKMNMINAYPRLLPSDEMSIMKSQNSNKTDDNTNKKKKKKNDNNDDDDDMSLPQPPISAVLVYLGVNDVVSLKDADKYNESKLTSAYETMLKRIRHRRPIPIPIIIIVPTLNAVVTCCKSERKRQEVCEIQNRLWTTLVQEKLGGIDQGYYIIENQHDPSISLNSKSDYGMCLHWNVDSHVKWARGLEHKVRDILLQQQPVLPLQQQEPEQQQKERIGINVKDRRNYKIKDVSKRTKQRDCV